MESSSVSSLYKMINQTIQKSLNTKDSLQQYLNIQSLFSYSVNNCFLIMSQKPNSYKLMDEESWFNNESVEVIDKNNPIKILEPTEKRNDGYWCDFKVKNLYDITQTNSSQESEIIKYDDKTFLKALLNCYSFGVELADELIDNKDANLDLGENVLYIKKGVQAPKIFYAIIEELVKIELKTDMTNEVSVLKNKCCSYMLLKKYNIDMSKFELGEIPYNFKRLDVKNKKIFFNGARVGLLEVSSKLDQYLNFFMKQPKTKSYER